MIPEPTEAIERLWLWRNFVDGRPEYLAFDNPFPCYENGDPTTLGEPCGWAVLKKSQNGRPDVSSEKVESAMEAAREPEAGKLREALDVLSGIIGNANEAMRFGPFDCIDNDGDAYQSEAFQKALERGRGLLARTALSRNQGR